MEVHVIINLIEGTSKITRPKLFFSDKFFNFTKSFCFDNFTR
jgi:hypothetical protein